MEYMKGLKDNAFDVCITSPPYNMNLRVNSKGTGYCSRQIVKELSSKYSGFSDNLPMADYEEFLCDTVAEINRVCGLVFFNIQMITGNKPALFRFLGRFADEIKELIIWDKTRGQPAIGEGVLNSCYELIVVMGDKPITRAFQSPVFSRGTVDNIIRVPPARSANREHKASYPVALSDELISSFVSSGQSVFDPFMGTGTTAISCDKKAIHFTGCEIDLGYFCAAKARIEAETAQSDLFWGGK
jgi:site-specific DNA-methyltransferase (adenine-specific)/modification methylase